MIEIDGSYGEGGGQILRTALAASAITGKPFRAVRIRAGRKRPGLGHQHLTAVRAAAAICGAEVEGDLLGSMELRFVPGRIEPGSYEFDVRTAGSTSLVAQTVAIPLACATRSSRVVVKGGTHNEAAPPFEALDRAYAPLLERMGCPLSFQLDRYGFYPAGEGAITLAVSPASWKTLELLEPGPLERVEVQALVSLLDPSIAPREIDAAKAVLEELGEVELEVRTMEVDSSGPGNALNVIVVYRDVTEVFTAFGRKGVRAEEVGRSAARQAMRYVRSHACVGDRLADQLLLPMVLAGGGTFTTLPPTKHFVTNCYVLGHFFETAVYWTPKSGDATIVTVG